MGFMNSNFHLDLSRSVSFIHFDTYGYVYRSNSGHKEDAFWEYLLGFTHVETCENEIIKKCGCVSSIEYDNSIQSIDHLISHFSDDKIMNNTGNNCPILVTIPSSNVHQLTNPIGCPDDSLRSFLMERYWQMRLFYPLQTPQYSYQNINLAIHVRTGQGQSKGFDADSYLNVTRFLIEQFDQRGHKVHVHFLTELQDIPMTAWDEFIKDNTFNFTIYNDPNRYEMFHHLASADILIQSNSGFSTAAALVNKNLKMYIVAPSHLCNGKNYSKSWLSWNPCGYNGTIPKHHSYHCSNIGVNITQATQLVISLSNERKALIKSGNTNSSRRNNSRNFETIKIYENVKDKSNSTLLSVFLPVLYGITIVLVSYIVIILCVRFAKSMSADLPHIYQRIELNTTN
jgi:hypothetical protein